MSTDSITIPASSTDELLHALSVQVIVQQGQITTLLVMITQLYASNSGMPTPLAQQLLEQWTASSTASANSAFIATLQERRQGLADQLFQ